MFSRFRSEETTPIMAFVGVATRSQSPRTISADLLQLWIDRPYHPLRQQSALQWRDRSGALSHRVGEAIA
ncbi:hypothetical protein KR51_00031720 [Rubidibacter lacunae KORDI 51-2]|uniref:Uncharacterized protein n=1 Tax=Rubidibacter lacunae KORDI 51-2 TaxID=582515 RepID=U5D6F8_9CHRO|nr:hypothetical protein [Rubidibacter lacunae]ERN40233.1 hypothetical protein KR51_00031720 [Rubidibacter lacunae KORDI 51-2]